jgi:uncharacterized membrane protein YoaK (UPF0700 family)
MISKLPRWVEYGAFVLAFVAGTVNAVGLLGMQHQAVSHVSGTATLVGTGVIASSGSDVFHLVGILLSFLAGASLSGSMLPGTSLRLGRHYDSLLAIEGLMLLLSIYLLKNDSLLGHYTASAACGIQNAMATSYSGAVVRTTHMTGIFTDLGLMIGAKLRGDSFDKRKAILLLLIVVGFIIGGTLGAYLYININFYALAIPAAICFLLAAMYRVYIVKFQYNPV